MVRVCLRQPEGVTWLMVTVPGELAPVAFGPVARQCIVAGVCDGANAQCIVAWKQK